MITTVDKVLALMDKYPRLTPHGHGAPIGATTFDEARAEMLTAGFLREVCICRAWLQEATKTQKINPRAGSSYGLKHAVEDTTGQYVCNGAFIMAALLEGFQIGRGFNPCLNIAKRRRTVPEKFLKIAPLHPTGAMHPLPTALTTRLDQPRTRQEP